MPHTALCRSTTVFGRRARGRTSPAGCPSFPDQLPRVRGNPPLEQRSVERPGGVDLVLGQPCLIGWILLIVCVSLLLVSLCLGVWALYSEKDKFPNNYAFIEKVDLKHNEVQARWLEICHDGEVEKRSMKEDQTVGCGNFRISSFRSVMTCTDTKPFSHPVHAIFTGRRNSYEIYPRKGEVWALLKGWEIHWSSAADFSKNYKYEVVQVLSDFTTGTSINVMPLVKIKVFVSLFMQSKEANPYLIPPDDTIWFSHCIPYHLMNASESEGIPEGALELDPAALPLNLEEALACVLPESSSVKGQEFDANYAGTIGGNDSRNGSLRVGVQHATCVNPRIFTEIAVEKNRHQNTPPAPDATDVDEEPNDFIQAEVECPSNRRELEFNSVSNNGLDQNADDASYGFANGLSREKEKIFNSVSNNGDDASYGDTIICADSEFFDFYQLRDEKQFRAKQIWAVYDSQGCMPRFYARITKVSMTPFGWNLIPQIKQRWHGLTGIYLLLVGISRLEVLEELKKLVCSAKLFLCAKQNKNRI
ncbi:hypothetical protein BRADI_1g27388v3 [Brachypodium distachyon]|uniref:DUF3444 domain-containing protein n=1 Tax=Brachypodium distachyon TaxID=15368 RepID=A0A0Q3H0M0_BRADI|nr:hypothetical protein BRADI_1g27388v3 [Brachypodium distachyon]